MKSNNIATTEIFRKGSTTFYTSALFFPSNIRDDIAKFYAFVRTADDFVDTIPAQPESYHAFKSSYYEACAGKASGDPVIDEYVLLARTYQFDPEWTNAFFASMEMDLSKRSYETLSDTLAYVYGSAEVIGLFTAAMLKLPTESFVYAQQLGRSFQYINMIRDIAEDEELGRCYFPHEELKAYGLTALTSAEAYGKPEAFIKYLQAQVIRYQEWQKEAAEGFGYIPRSSRIAIQTAADMYMHTSAVIYKDPFIVFKEKVKPSKPTIVLRALANTAGL